jgi:drug/metabolite transporter (DMT)-like permease
MRATMEKSSPPAGMSERTKALLLGLAVIVIWGISFSATRAAVQEIPPLTLAFLRFLVASALLAPIVRRKYGVVRLPRRERLLVMAMGLNGVTLAFVFENVGLRYTTASHGALLISLTPLVSAAAEVLLGRSRPSLKTLGGLVAALAGVVLIVGSPLAGGATLLGDALILANVVSWVVYSFLTERLTDRLPNLVITTKAIIFGTIALAPLAAIELWREGMGVPGPTAVVAVFYLGIFCSALAYVWWNRTLSVVGVTVTNSLIYCIPLVGVAAGVLMLGEPLTWWVAGGGVLIIGGVALATASSPPEVAPRG